jgi:hypothetical protein
MNEGMDDGPAAQQCKNKSNDDSDNSKRLTNWDVFAVVVVVVNGVPLAMWMAECRQSLFLLSHKALTLRLPACLAVSLKKRHAIFHRANSNYARISLCQRSK